jgi:hypothetical protein
MVANGVEFDRLPLRLTVPSGGGCLRHGGDQAACRARPDGRAAARSRSVRVSAEKSSSRGAGCCPVGAARLLPSAPTGAGLERLPPCEVMRVLDPYGERGMVSERIAVERGSLLLRVENQPSRSMPRPGWSSRPCWRCCVAQADSEVAPSTPAGPAGYAADVVVIAYEMNRATPAGAKPLKRGSRTWRGAASGSLVGRGLPRFGVRDWAWALATPDTQSLKRRI